MRSQASLRAASRVLMGIFLALLLQSALDSFLAEMLAGAPSRIVLDFDSYWSAAHRDIRWLQVSQLAVFIALLIRFYLGAFRLHRGQDQRKPRTAIFDLFSTGVLFASFYGMSKTIGSISEFYVFVIIAHIIDLVWFSARHVVHGKSEKDYKVYIGIDLVTLVFIILFRSYFGTGGGWHFTQWSILAFLMLVSLLDIWCIQIRQVLSHA